MKTSIEYHDNSAILHLKTYFDVDVYISCIKSEDQSFRPGGTGISALTTYEGVILGHQNDKTKIRIFRDAENFFDAEGILSPEEWPDNHCFVTEYYPLECENRPHSWIISRKPLNFARTIFVNVDVMDESNRCVKRYRIDPFFGKYIEING